MVDTPKFSMKGRSGKNGSKSTEPSLADTHNEDMEHAKFIEGIKRVYKNKVKPLETTYNFEGFHSAPLTDSDIEAKPMVLLIGQYSTGKTTFIHYLLDKKYPGEHIGVEPTTDRFVAIMNGTEERVIPGNAAAVSSDLPFHGLNRFGQAFLSRFQVSQTPSPVLENMTIIDTPGILAGDKQSIERGYNFTQTIEWFAERSDLILLMFDAHKLDISNEFQMAIQSLRGLEEKVRVVLNKSDMVSQQQLMRVYGAMMWSLGKVVETPEVMRVYLGSFWVDKPPNCFEDCRELIETESRDLLVDLKALRRNAAIRKVNEIVKRARLAKVHALIISHLKKEMPSMFGKKKKQEVLLKNLGEEFKKIQQRYHLPAGDFPNPERFRQNLALYDMDKFKSFKGELIEKADEALANDFPKLMQLYPTGNRQLEKSELNPFEKQTKEIRLLCSFDEIDKSAFMPLFNSLSPREGKISGGAASGILKESGLPNDILADIWRLADWDHDGYLDEDEFCVAMHLTSTLQKNASLPNAPFERLPDKLPIDMLPKRKF